MNKQRKKWGKDRGYLTERQRFYNYLKKRICTCTEAAMALGIAQKNLCRYKRHLERKGLLWEVFRSGCPITGHPAWFITTNRALR
jgi:predicted transcriptional regulator of viral defense system